MSDENQDLEHLTAELKSVELSLEIARRDNQILRKRNYTMKWVALGALALAALFYSCPRTVVQKEVVPLYMYEQSKRIEITQPGTYSIQARPDGIFIFPVNEEKK